jgi:hypothetical protein
MTAALGQRFAVRVMVTDAWDQVFLAVGPETTVAELKRQALMRALKKADPPVAEFLVKFRGAAVSDGATLGALGAGANAPFIVLRARRQAVR